MLVLMRSLLVEAPPPAVLGALITFHPLYHSENLKIGHSKHGVVLSALAAWTTVQLEVIERCRQRVLTTSFMLYAPTKEHDCSANGLRSLNANCKDFDLLSEGGFSSMYMSSKVSFVCHPKLNGCWYARWKVRF
jgi:hypothetical protein